MMNLYVNGNVVEYSVSDEETGWETVGIGISAFREMMHNIAHGCKRFEVLWFRPEHHILHRYAVDVPSDYGCVEFSMYTFKTGEDHGLIHEESFTIPYELMLEVASKL